MSKGAETCEMKVKEGKGRQRWKKKNGKGEERRKIGMSVRVCVSPLHCSSKQSNSIVP